MENFDHVGQHFVWVHDAALPDVVAASVVELLAVVENISVLGCLESHEALIRGVE